MTKSALHILSRIALCFTLCACAVSCVNEIITFPPDSTKPETERDSIKINAPDMSNLSGKSDTIEVNISTLSHWRAYAPGAPDWFTPITKVGIGNQTIKVAIQENLSDTSRYTNLYASDQWGQYDRRPVCQRGIFQIVATPNMLRFKSSHDTLGIKVKCDSYYLHQMRVDSNRDWISILRLEGRPKLDSCLIIVTPNTTGRPRDGDVFFSYLEFENAAKITIDQL